jgi:photosystem II stability/assembly factor-like uncharacterized protein
MCVLPPMKVSLLKHYGIIGVALAFVLTNMSAHAASAATTAPPLVFHAVTFVSSATGWIAGDGAIFGTTDGGRSWHRQYTGRVELTSVSFANSLDGWAAGVDPIPGTGVLLGTRDGGRTWSTLVEPRNPAREVSFADPSVGYAVAGGSPLTPENASERMRFFGGRIARTSDGGHAWNMLDNPMLVDTACASSTKVAWAAYQAAVLRSDDGGDTFSHVLSPQIDTKRTWFANVRCAGDSAAWAQFTSTPVGDQRPFVVYRTSDAGAHWQPVLVNAKTPDAYPLLKGIADGPGPWPGAFAAVDANTAFFLGVCPGCGSHGAVSIAGTADGGATWQPVATVPDVTVAGPIALSFADATHGWVVGTSANGTPVVEVTANGGTTWTRQHPQ